MASASRRWIAIRWASQNRSEPSGGLKFDNCSSRLRSMNDDLASGFQEVDRAAEFAVFSSCLTLVDSTPLLRRVQACEL